MSDAVHPTQGTRRPRGGAVSDQPTHYVLSDMPCDIEPDDFAHACKANVLRCSAWCLGNGRRLDVESRVAVKRRVSNRCNEVWTEHPHQTVWVPGTTEETP
jgi:hypothetical protein